MNYFPQEYYSETEAHTPLKVDLFTKIHEIKGITDHLVLVNQYPELKKKAWLNEHEVTISNMLEKFVEHLPFDLDQDGYDQQLVKLLMEYSKSLQQMVTVAHTMLHKET